MPSRLKLLVLFVMVCLCFDSVAQGDMRFASYDCRKHADNFVVSRPEIPATNDPVEIVFIEEPVIVIDTTDGWKTWAYAENFSFGKNRGAIPMITELDALHPYFRDQVRELIRQCREKGIELAIVETYRTHAKQHEYKNMGRKYTSSGAGRSKHQYGLAVDVVPIVDSVASWHDPVLWRKIGTTGEKLGLRWGGRWRRPYDPGHFEWTGGLSSSQLSAGILPPVPKAQVTYPCLADDIKLLRKYWKEWETSQSALTRK